MCARAGVAAAWALWGERPVQAADGPVQGVDSAAWPGRRGADRGRRAPTRGGRCDGPASWRCVAGSGLSQELRPALCQSWRLQTEGEALIRRAPVGVFALALLVRAWVVDWTAVVSTPHLIYDGHERAVIAALAGAPPDGSAQAWPATLWLWESIGRLAGADPRLPIAVSVLLGAASAALAARALGGRAGLWAGLLVALLPQHVAYSTSAANVILPALLVHAALGARPRGAVGLGVAAACLRPESALALGLLRPWVGLLPALVGVGWLLWGQPAEAVPWGLALRSNLLLVPFLAPWPLLGLAALSGRWRGLLGMALLFVASALFADLGPRHLIVGGVLVAGMAARAAARWPLLGLLALGAMAAEVGALEGRWHARKRLEVPIPAGLPAGLPAGCVEVTEEPPIPGQRLPSHLQYLSGELDAACVVWGVEPWHLEWSSRGLADRAARMEALYHLRPVGWRSGPGGRRVYMALERR